MKTKIYCFNSHFLLLVCYVPNVAKRSLWDQCKKKYILRTDRRPTTDNRPRIWENSNGHISARGRVIHFMFGSTVGFSGSADRMALLTVSPNLRWRLGRHLGKFKWRYLRSGSSDLLRVWFQDGVFGDCGWNGAISGFAKSKMAARQPSWKIQMAISLRRIIWFTPCLVLWWGFGGRRIEWRYFRFRQIQDGGSAAILQKFKWR